MGIFQPDWTRFCLVNHKKKVNLELHQSLFQGDGKLVKSKRKKNFLDLRLSAKIPPPKLTSRGNLVKKNPNVNMPGCQDVVQHSLVQDQASITLVASVVAGLSPFVCTFLSCNSTLLAWPAPMWHPGPLDLLCQRRGQSDPPCQCWGQSNPPCRRWGWANISVTFPPTVKLPAVGGAVGKAQSDI